MKLLSTVAAGALLLAGCAPFEHGHYADDVNYINDVGDRPGTPVLVGAGYSDPYYDQVVQPASYVHSEPAYAEPVYSSPAPIVQASYVEPIHEYAPPPVQVVHSAPRVVHRERPRFIEQPQYVEPQYVEPQYIEPASTYEYEVEVAPILTSLPAPKPIQYAAAPPLPIVAATSVSVEEERYIGETRYAPPEVINAPPVFMRGPGQFSNQPFPDPGYPQFGAPAPGFGFSQQQGYGFPQPQPGFGGYGNPYGMPIAANTRPPYPQGYGAPYGNNGCVTTCGGTPVF